ncbi:MAG: T9SS type A sorting domain-containing protein [Saprospiraceae bacterium]|nr:T9SS type A sorting domain-containing protein [Saprospiraceae bacterium]
MKLTLQLLFLLAFGATQTVQAQWCGEHLNLESQANINAFPSMYPNCPDWENTFYIMNSGTITNLDSLIQLRSVNSRLWISNCPNLTDISGLRNLTYVKDLRIANCPKLTSLAGLENLKRVDGLNIGNNAMLTELISFDSLRTLGGIVLSNNPLLVQVGHFPVLEKAPGVMLFMQNPQLPNLQGGFPLLDTLPYLTIDSCANFTSFTGLEHVRRIQNLTAWKNHNLLNFNGLDSLRYINNFIVQRNSQLRNLEGLTHIDTIAKLTVRWNKNIENLTGLGSLKRLAEMEIRDNKNMTSLEGLPNNNCFDKGILWLAENPRIKNLHGLEGTRRVGLLNIFENDSLQNLRGLDSLRYVVAVPTSTGTQLGLLIWENPLLENLHGLEHLDSSQASLAVNTCPSLTSLEGVDALRYVDGLSISENPRLKNLHGLENLQIIQGSVYIRDNDSLQTLQGIGPVAGPGEALSIRNNPMLSECAVQGICNLTNAVVQNALSSVGAPQYPDFSGNLPSCDHYTKVLDSCSTDFSNFGGRVFMDAECDTLPGGTIVGMPYRVVRRTSDNIPVAVTNANGYFSGVMPVGESLAFKTDPIEHYTYSPDSQFIAATASTTQHLNRNFKHCPDFQFNDLRVSIAPIWRPIPGFKHAYKACVENRGTTTTDVNLAVILDGPVADNYVTLSDLGGGQSFQPNTVVWDVQDVPQFQTRCRTVTVLNSTSSPLGEYVVATASASPNPVPPFDIQPDDNSATLALKVVSSFDPNDKQVDRERINIENLPNEAHELFYTVRFQNTGTAPATFIEVLDTLPAELDIRTFEPWSVSHKCRVSFPAGNVVKWRFDNINLPDSSSNQEGSHGYIQFKIRTLPGMQVLDTVRNRVGIYFDYNEVVLTNYAQTVFYVPVATQSPDNAPLLRAYPNPASSSILFDGLETASTIRVFDISGREVATFQEVQNRQVLSIDALPNGYYLASSTGGQWVKFVVSR